MRSGRSMCRGGVRSALYHDMPTTGPEYTTKGAGAGSFASRYWQRSPTHTHRHYIFFIQKQNEELLKFFFIRHRTWIEIWNDIKREYETTQITVQQPSTTKRFRIKKMEKNNTRWTIISQANFNNGRPHKDIAHRRSKKNSTRSR